MMAAQCQYHQRGSVLIVSMVVLALISAMAGRIVYQTRLELQIQQQVNALTQLRALARGAAHQFASSLSRHVEETSNGPKQKSQAFKGSTGYSLSHPRQRRHLTWDNS